MRFRNHVIVWRIELGDFKASRPYVESLMQSEKEAELLKTASEDTLDRLDRLLKGYYSPPLVYAWKGSSGPPSVVPEGTEETKQAPSYDKPSHPPNDIRDPMAREVTYSNPGPGPDPVLRKLFRAHLDATADRRIH
jgi:hypothetical protein